MFHIGGRFISTCYKKIKSTEAPLQLVMLATGCYNSIFYVFHSEIFSFYKWTYVQGVKTVCTTMWALGNWKCQCPQGGHIILHGSPCSFWSFTPKDCRGQQQNTSFRHPLEEQTNGKNIPRELGLERFYCLKLSEQAI